MRAPFFEIHVPKALNDLKQGNVHINEQELIDFCNFVDQREDCNDFRMVALQRLYLEYKDDLSNTIQKRIKQTILNFRYWMTEQGNDNMCYWSENHQILFASIEYVACTHFKEELFTNENKQGKDKIAYAEERIHHWLDLRYNTGFIEWHSHVYYAEDLAALMHLIDFSNNEAIIKKATIVTDLLFFDCAIHSYKGNFALTHGRSYEQQKKSPINADIAPIMSEVFGFTNVPYLWHHIANIFHFRLQYQVPQIIVDIAKDESTVILKDQMGFDLKNIHKELHLQNELDRFVLWQMEAFTNKEAIEYTIDMLNEYNLYTNMFLSDFKSISHPLLRKLRLLPLISRVLNPFTNGVAIQKANTYTYKTNFYSMSTAQNHHPGEFGDQQHIMNICLSEELNIFVTHPSILPYDDDNAYLSLSPTAWVGNGRMPHSVQHESVNISMFHLPSKKAYMEKSIMDYTHVYFPEEKLDDVTVKDNYAFARYGNAYIALIGNGDFIQEPDQIKLYGKRNYWIFEVSSLHQETYDTFITRIRNNLVDFRNNTVNYISNNNQYVLKYKKEFKINNQVIDTSYKRLDTPYCTAERYPELYQIHYQNHTLTLDLKNLVREEI